MKENGYRGRLAPTPTGYLHLGHAHTFHIAWQRARAANGCLLFRQEDIDRERCRADYATAALEDLRWLGLDWDEGPDVGGPYPPYTQSENTAYFQTLWRKLLQDGYIYPCSRSRKAIREAGLLPHGEEEEPIYPPDWRPPPGTGMDTEAPSATNWRFRVPDGQSIAFEDQRLGPQRYVAGQDFGDFLVWRKNGEPAYELAVVADDYRMGITEVVRGADLLLSTARQILLYRAMGWTPPAFYHAPLICDKEGKRLAKRHQSLSLRTMRDQGLTPRDILHHRLTEDTIS